MPQLLRLTLSLGKLLNLHQLCLCGLEGRNAQLLHQALSLAQGGHLLRHRHIRVVLIAQQFGLLLPEGENLVDDGCVVRLPFRGAGEVGAVHLLPQRAVLAVGQNGQVGGDVEREQPGALLRRGALVPLSLGGLRSQRQRGGRQPLDVRRVGDQLLERLGGVEHVVAELCGQLAQLLLDLIEPLLRVTLQSNTAQNKVAQFPVHDALLSLRKRLPRGAVTYGLEALIDGFALRHA
mmetsp:Transcript_35807/g.63909  ORF Transcript_35807/g.63909 Transcript_35807/m.63909 type:complete len:235 (+) Transcript_35807:849-1553(+)